MNKSKEDGFSHCVELQNILVRFFFWPIRGKKYERNKIAVLVINFMLLFLTISLNGLSVKAIKKSSRLRSKLCYFVILLQSVVDLGVGFPSIPLHLLFVEFGFKRPELHSHHSGYSSIILTY